MLTVAILGPVEVRRDGELLAVPTGRTTEVLVRLAIEAGQPVRAATLLEDLWPGEVGVAPNSLQAKISKLRRVLGDPGLVVSDGGAYTLHVDPADVDALAVLGEPADPVAALAMFQGEPLPAAGAWAEPWRVRLTEARLRLTEENAPDTVAELRELVAAHPYRERFWELLITALYRSGRQADALAAYRQVRALLADDLGLAPGPALRELESRILRHDTTLRPPTGNLPVTGGDLIGRTDDLTELAALLADERLVTVTGPAGVGKTRLAVEAARRAGGAWLVRLENARPTTIWPTIGEALGLSEATAETVLARLPGLGPLLVLDNCEHLADALAPIVDRILESVPGLRILATSQVPLGTAAETVHVLRPLPLPDSMILFRRRASRQRRTFQADDAVVEALCRALDGLPLAIELAAARAKALSAAEIAHRLDDRFTLLNDPTSRRPVRQRTLHAALAWSHDLLLPDDRRGLWALAWFADGAHLDAVEHVLTALDVPAAPTLDVITRLVDRSLVIVDESPDGRVRYRLLDSVRAFARQQSPAPEVARRAHAEWFGAAATRAAIGLRGQDQGQHLARVRTERADIEAALTWTADHDPALGLRIANGFGWAWVFLGGGRDAAARHRAALDAAVDAPKPDRVDGLLFTGWFEASGGDLARAEAGMREAIALADTPQSRARAHLFLAFVHSQQGRPADALTALAEYRTPTAPTADHPATSSALAGAPEADWESGAAWLLTAWASLASGDVAAARQACDEAVRRLGPTGDAWALSHAEALLGGLAQAEHRFADAVTHLSRAVKAAGALDFGAAAALHRANLGRAQHQLGDLTAAKTTLKRAADDAYTAGDLRIVALARVRLARILRAEGHLDQAESEIHTALHWYATAGGGDGERLAEYLSAALAADRDAAEAGAELDRVLAAARADGDVEITLLTLDRLALLRSDPALAAEADTLFPTARHLITDADRIDRAARRATPG
ncbi:BTAD domain-containing putative transcriptional regulator [Actinoplanes sichuanensis]|uniref:BTAD domain-containing putative transcriptional regulator n=1 Tax=Actinoplanes sichuanensis TaxID=512349 RepID=A0ABW4AQ73_9ACTN|nr:BTAD domain-containing putative transcriptional regulator [Actinoplanes sichuanensis]BEL06586.1 BTAD domain-containing putative transcriptional regulator [Actinoplanes sichuanensis]